MSGMPGPFYYTPVRLANIMANVVNICRAHWAGGPAFRVPFAEAGEVP